MRKYSTLQIANDVILRYSEGKLSVPTGEADRIRKVLERICKQTIATGRTTLWEKSTVKTGKAIRHEFSEHEKEMLMQSPELLKYLLSHERDYPKAKELLENIEEAERQNNIARQYVEEKSSEEGAVQNEEEFGVSGRDLRSAKLMMMVEALFLQYFTPIDMTKLEEDLELYKLGAGGTSTPETVAAEKRLMDFLNYCTPKKA